MYERTRKPVSGSYSGSSIFSNELVISLCPDKGGKPDSAKLMDFLNHNTEQIRSLRVEGAIFDIETLQLLKRRFPGLLSLDLEQVTFEIKNVILFKDYFPNLRLLRLDRCHHPHLLRMAMGIVNLENLTYGVNALMRQDVKLLNCACADVSLLLYGTRSKGDKALMLKIERLHAIHFNDFGSLDISTLPTEHGYVECIAFDGGKELTINSSRFFRVAALPRYVKELEIKRCPRIYRGVLTNFLTLSGAQLTSLTLHLNFAMGLSGLKNCLNLEFLDIVGYKESEVQVLDEVARLEKLKDFSFAGLLGLRRFDLNKLSQLQLNNLRISSSLVLMPDEEITRSIFPSTTQIEFVDCTFSGLLALYTSRA